MTRDELTEFIRDNFDPEDIWEPYELETDHDDCYTTTHEITAWAAEEGWVNPSDARTYEMCHVETMADHLGLTIGPATRSIEAYHDTQGHTGAVQWCNHPMCSGEEI